ncbi:hypothetical protein [Streptomyces griseoaurantiacus]|uniref:hypothetical protein n=1 Tax=Streptomyces griseoaurantiacus TaxID=68213 RepID=UPI0030E5C7AC
MRRKQLQAAYRDAVAELARADESGNGRRIRMARWRVAEAVQRLRVIGVDPVRGRMP